MPSQSRSGRQERRKQSLAQRQSAKKRESRHSQRYSRELIQLMVQQVKTMLTQQQGTMTLQNSHRLSKRLENLKKLSHKMPQGWKSFKDTIKRLDMAFSGLLPLEVALNTAPKEKNEPRSLSVASMGPYQVPLERADRRSYWTPPRAASKEDHRMMRSIEASPTSLMVKRRDSGSKEQDNKNKRSSRSSSTKAKKDIPQMKVKLERSHSADRIEKDVKKVSVPEKRMKKRLAKKKSIIKPSISFGEISHSSYFSSKLTRPRPIEIEPSDSKTNENKMFEADISGQSSSTTSKRSISFTAKSKEPKEDSVNKKPFDLLSRVRYLSYHLPTRETKKESKESCNRPLDIMDSIRNRITISESSFISRAKLNAALDDAVSDVPYHQNLLEASEEENRILHERQERQMRLIRQAQKAEPKRRLQSSEGSVNSRQEPEPFPDLNVAAVREEWVRYFAQLEKTPMELLLEQRRSERAALELQRQEAQQQAAEQQRLQLERQTHPWRYKRRPKKTQDMYTLSDLFPQPEKAYEVCPECGTCVCCMEQQNTQSPIIVTEEMIRKFRYLRVAKRLCSCVN
ncbi:uncharacterized protein DMAD_10584 [Drosophila madeirensis]|uniref:Uncharacterized protein n=1 Tax=Drosophila madeirensis TaxID=30013 RepID=A0AAU9FA36_DROMD